MHNKKSNNIDGTHSPAVDQARPNPGQETLREVFPEAHDLLSARYPPLSESIDGCDVVLDTNVLLLPYVAAKESIDDIVGVLSKLAENDRLFLPARVVREFAGGRAHKLGDLVKAISDHESEVGSLPAQLHLPALEAQPEHQKISGAYEQLMQAKKRYKGALAEAKTRIVDWEWDDPVITAYRTIFSSLSSVVELEKSFDEVQDFKRHRFAQKIPPGYKDASKDDGGVGDPII